MLVSLCLIILKRRRNQMFRNMHAYTFWKDTHTIVPTIKKNLSMTGCGTYANEMLMRLGRSLDQNLSLIIFVMCFKEINFRLKLKYIVMTYTL